MEIQYSYIISSTHIKIINYVSSQMEKNIHIKIIYTQTHI